MVIVLVVVCIILLVYAFIKAGTQPTPQKDDPLERDFAFEAEQCNLIAKKLSIPYSDVYWVYNSIGECSFDKTVAVLKEKAAK